MSERALFSSGELRDYLQQHRTKANDLLVNWDPEMLLNTAEADATALILDAATVAGITLHRDEAYLLDPTEVVISRREFGMDTSRRVGRFTLAIPYRGDGKLFGLRASTYSSALPRAQLIRNEIRFFCDGVTRADQAKAAFERELDQLEKYLGWTNRDIEMHNQQMKHQIPNMVRERRATLLAARRVQADIGYPIRQRDDAGTYTVPMRRKQITPERRPRRAVPTSTGPFQPEPALDDKDYEAALKVLLNSRNALERSPSMTAKLSEEHIRDLLLMNLNAQFEGAAAGEIFNGSGKTDILIRVDDANIFIGECKIWRGPKTVTEALNQLLTYLVWRDTKAALLLFIKQGDVSSVTSKAISKLEEHPNFKRRGTHANEDRHDFVLHARGDPAREIHLALLPFLIANPT